MSLFLIQSYVWNQVELSILLYALKDPLSLSIGIVNLEQGSYVQLGIL